QNGGRVGTYFDITPLIYKAGLLGRLGTVGALTNLFNRRPFLGQGDAERSRFQRYHLPLSLLLLDIDHINSVTDPSVHAVGDEVIAAVANACQSSKRNSDIAGRLGGEEFAILLPETEAGQAQVVGERIRESVAAQVFGFHKVRFNVTVSIGIAQATVGMS